MMTGSCQDTASAVSEKTAGDRGFQPLRAAPGRRESVASDGTPEGVP
jgi:hypothetical protein